MLELVRGLRGINLFHSVQIQMQRKFQISKQTEDKVKVARQFIEHKYQQILRQEQELQVNWEKVLHIMDTSNLKAPQKKVLAERILQQETLNKRISRQRDCLANYHLYQLIGRGAFGQVKLARDKATGDLVVIKRMSKSKLIGKKQISSAYLEREFMIKNASKFLVQLKSTFQDKEYLYIAMEYVCGGDLLHLLIDKDIFSQTQTRFYIAELVLAIEKVHSMNYIHRDIKPDNILIGRDGHIKISDFGLSKYIEPRKTVLTKMASLRKHTELREGRTKAYSKVGTPDYIAPQVLTEETYSQNADIWSIGVIMFECLFGYPPFSHEDSREVCQRVMNWPKYLEFPKDSHVSSEAYDLILGTMAHCEERLTIPQIKMHPFFEGIDWGQISELKPPFIPALKNELDTHNFEQFDNVDWIGLESEGNELGNQRRKSHSSHAHFAGFDFVKKGDDTIVDTAVRQIKAILQPCKSLQKYQASPFMKSHVDFLECSSSKMSKKGVLGRKSSKMLRSSSKENNMSLKDFRKVKKCSLPKRANGFKLQAL